MRHPLIAAALALSLGGCSLFTPTSHLTVAPDGSLDGQAPPGTHWAVIEGSDGSCMPKRMAVGGAQDLKSVTGEITCTDKAGVVEHSTFALGEVGATGSQAIVAASTARFLDTVDKGLDLAKMLAATAAGGPAAGAAVGLLNAVNRPRAVGPMLQCPAGTIITMVNGQPACQ